MVETLRLVSRGNALPGIILLLKAVSANLRSLIYEAVDPAFSEAYFDELITSLNLCFPSLERIRISPNCMEYFASIFHLCNISPRLNSKDLRQSGWHDASRDASDAPLSALERDTSLEKLRVVFNEPDTEAEYVIKARPVLELISRSPNLRQLSVENMDITREEIKSQILKVFTDSDFLEDLHWSIHIRYFKAFIADHPGAFHSIRRLIMKCAEVGQGVSVFAVRPIHFTPQTNEYSILAFHHFRI